MPQPHRHREESVNTQLALLLSQHGVIAEPETLQRSGKQRPDVMFLLDGLRVIIEGKFADTPDAENTVLSDALKRVQTGICHIAAALVYPENIRTVPASRLGEILSETRVRFLIISETGQTEWARAVPSEILTVLRRVQESLCRDDIVAEAASRLSEKIENIAALWIGQPVTCDRLSDILGIPAKRGESADEQAARRITATKVASLVLANAMIFQEQLAISGGDGSVDSLRSYNSDTDPIDSLMLHWRGIWEKINYVPVFQLGEAVLREIPASPNAISAIRLLLTEAKSICANQSALRHDLMGRIYHWLLHHAKYLGTYYTATSSATLLLKLVFAQKWEGRDFGSPKKLEDFAVADPACGTGTLLMAAAQAITDQFVVSRVKKGRTVDEKNLSRLHQILMEKVLYGYDVLPSAVHLTASTLGMLAPHVTYRSMNLFVMPMGVKNRSLRLGSLDFINKKRVTTQISLDNTQMEIRQTGVSGERFTSAEIPEMDLCVMNPPFVRSVGGNLLFGSLPDDERTKLQTELKKCSKDLQCSVTAGLGSVFLALADKYLRTDGRMAFILPVALATGEAWGANRKLLADRYHVEMVMVSHDADRPNFSENTNLSEIMFIARKRKKDELPGETVYVNLWRNPHSIYEALTVAGGVRICRPASVDSAGITSVIGAGDRKFAEVISLPPSQGEEQWTGVQFAQTWTLRAAMQLQQGKLAVPGKKPVDVPLCRLGELGSLGYDQRDIHDAFTVSETDWSPYPAFWNHDSKKVVCLKQKHNSHLLPRSVAAKGRKIKDCEKVAENAGNILLIERLGPVTHRVLAVGFDEPVLGNTWWAFRTDLADRQRKALLLWLNSSAALLLMLLHRVTTNGPWMKVKKPAWAAMPVLDVGSLPDEIITQLAKNYDAVCEKELMALARLDSDPVRAEIDAALSAALGLPDMKLLRQLLAREPGLTGKGLSTKPEQPDCSAC